MSKKSQSQKRKSSVTKETDDDLDEIIKEFTLKRGKSAYTFYILDMYRKEKEKDKTVSYINTNVKYSSKWRKLSQEEIYKYSKMSEKDKERYQEELKIVKTKLIKYNGKEGATAYRLFRDDYVRKAIERDDDEKEARKEAKEKWFELRAEKKRKWREKEKENDGWWEQAKKTGTATAYTVFIQKKMSEARENDESITFKDISKLWNQASDKEKRKYQKYADEMNKERQETRDIYEIEHGIKPKRPAGAFKLFMQEMSKEGKFEGKNAFKETRKLWEKLSEEEKEKYLTQSHRLRLCYFYKKIQFKIFMRKNFPSKAKSAYNIFTSELNGNDRPEKMKFFEYASSEWDKLSDKEKEKYQVKAQKERELFEKEKLENSERVFDYPKRPKTSYQLFTSERLIQLKKEKPKEEMKSLMKICADEWNDMNKGQKKAYTKDVDKDRKRYKEQIRDFEENGFYTRTKHQIEEELEKRLSQREKRRSQRLSQSTSTKKEKKVKK